MARKWRENGEMALFSLKRLWGKSVNLESKMVNHPPLLKLWSTGARNRHFALLEFPIAPRRSRLTT